MAINANKTKNSGGGSDIQPIEGGTYPARLVAVIDVGLHPQSYAGQEKAPAYMVATTYELTDEFMKDEDGQDIEDKPRWVTETFPLYSLEVENAKSTKRYRSLDPTEEHEGDWGKLIGMPCNVTVVTNPGKGKHKGKVFSNIGAVSRMRSKDEKNVADLVNTPIMFDMDNPDLDMFNLIPKWQQKMIVNSLEYEGSPLAVMLEEGENVPKKENPQADKDLDDEVPY